MADLQLVVTIHAEPGTDIDPDAVAGFLLGLAEDYEQMREHAGIDPDNWVIVDIVPKKEA